MRTSLPVLLAAVALAAAACTSDVSPSGSYGGGTPVISDGTSTGSAAPTAGAPTSTGASPSASSASLTFRLTGTVKPFTAVLTTDGAKETFRDIRLPWSHTVDGTAGSYELQATPGPGNLTCQVLNAQGNVITQSSIGGTGGGQLGCGVSA